MSNPETQTTPKEVAAEGVKSEFLERVSGIPVVNVAKEYSTAAYDKVKQMNWFTSSTLTAAETAALYFAMASKPLLEKVQPQAQLVDQLACCGLDVVQEKVPFILKPPEQLVEDARKLCASAVTAGYQKVEDAKTFGIQKANEALSSTEGLVDRFLPPASGEGSSEVTNGSDSVPEKASKLTSKIGLRLLDHGVKHLLPVHKIGQESVAKLTYTVELLQQLKEDYTKKSVQEYVDDAKTKATWIWGELNTEQTAETGDARKSLEKRMLSFARRMTSILVHAYNVTAVPLSSFPSSYQEGLRTASRYTAELFSQFDQATNAGEVTVTFLQGLREKLSALENVIQGLKTESEQIEMDDLSKSTASEKSVEQKS